MPDPTLVSGWSAGRLDIWRRILNIAAIAVPIVVGLGLSAVGVTGPALAVVIFTLFVGLFTTSLVFGMRVTRAMRREMTAGYSTLYDVKDFELRDARTLELIRDAKVAPERPGQRSLVANMFQIKPGTVLSKRIEDDKVADDKKPNDEA